ncbi:hypothetical protein PUN28_018034 [Cardiocondyla obscurior]|uniref:Uncharacterized protein n=1 Tax=Cardiocondyla obscurior TaxID=286306 RepID=A0AAW2ELE3_9HYME
MHTGMRVRASERTNERTNGAGGNTDRGRTQIAVYRREQEMNAEGGREKRKRKRCMNVCDSPRDEKRKRETGGQQRHSLVQSAARLINTNASSFSIVSRPGRSRVNDFSLLRDRRRGTRSNERKPFDDFYSNNCRESSRLLRPGILIHRAENDALLYAANINGNEIRTCTVDGLNSALKYYLALFKTRKNNYSFNYVNTAIRNRRKQPPRKRAHSKSDRPGRAHALSNGSFANKYACRTRAPRNIVTSSTPRTIVIGGPWFLAFYKTPLPRDVLHKSPGIANLRKRRETAPDLSFLRTIMMVSREGNCFFVIHFL